MSRPHRLSRCCARVVVAAAVSLTGCAGSDGIGEPVVEPTPNTVATDQPGDLFTDVSVGGPATANDGPVDEVVESIEPVSETGVPGLESDDDFCRGWSTFAGSIQALSLAWISQGPGSAATLEVAASEALVSAVEDMAANLPAEIESNRQALTVDVPAPWLRRAARAQALLAEAGADEPVIDALAVVWIAALAEFGTDDPSISIKTPLDADGVLPAAAGLFAAELPSVVNDPTLNTEQFDISPSIAYISDNCPDRGTLAGNDNVDGG